MKNKLLSLLGLCRKAGRLVSGFDAAAESVRKREARLVLTAGDLSPKSRKEIEFIAAKEGVEAMPAPVTIEEIEHKTGKRAGVLAITDKGLAESVKAAAARAQEEEQAI